MTNHIEDLQQIDFSFRPVIAPKPPEEIDEDDPMSRLQSVAYCSLNYSMHGDGISVDVDVSDSGYRYVVYPDDYNLDEDPDGEVSVESENPLTLGELLLLIETPIYSGMWIHSPFSCYWYVALDGEETSDDMIEGVEFTSGLYPDLPKFYKILESHFLAISHVRGVLPDEEEWMQLVVSVIKEGIHRSEAQRA